MAIRFQFSIRFLLVATAAVAAGVAVIRAEPSFQKSLAIDGLATVFLTTAIIGTIQTSGVARAFWIGTAVVLIPAFYGACTNAWLVLSYLTAYWDAVQSGRAGQMSSDLGGKSFLWTLWCAAPLNGLFAVIIYWLFATNRKPAA